MPALIQINEGKFSQVYPLGSNPMTIGRETGVEIMIPDDSVSSRHAMIYMDQGRYAVADLGATNGTQVNGAAVSTQYLNHRDMLKLGDLLFMFDENQEVANNLPTPPPPAAAPATGAPMLSSPVSPVARPVPPTTIPRGSLKGHAARRTILAKSSRITRAPSPSAQMRPISATMPAQDVMMAGQENAMGMVAPPSNFGYSPLALHEARKAKKTKMMMVLLVIALPISILLTLYGVVNSLPLEARESLVHGASTRRADDRSMLKSFLLKGSDTSEQPMGLEKGRPLTSSVLMDGPARLMMKLRFQQPVSMPLKLKVQVVPVGGSATDVILDQLVEVPPGAMSITLFSLPVNAGTFGINCSYEKGPEQMIPVNLVIFKEYE